MKPRRHPLPVLAALLCPGKDGAMVFEPAFAMSQDRFDKTLAQVKCPVQCVMADPA